mmetsp:Transcript_32327/g.81448  ORF Transcript_32327/g.81448 Transcript_32327/m.81448 type:complete len:389 (+) Transcript_32327:101-1267(+)
MHLSWKLVFATAVSLLAVSNADKTLVGGSGGWNEGDWFVQVDGVMGGRSSGRLSFPSSSVMKFEGTISLEGGGFSSVRSVRMEHDLSRYAGVSVAFETQAPGSVPLGMHLQFSNAGSRYSYASAFAVPPGQNLGDVATVFLPLWSFNRATSSGFRCGDCEHDPSKINGMDFYVLFQEGPFSVKILNVTALDAVPEAPAGPTTPLADSATVVSLVSDTISRSAYLYGQDYGELSVAVYDATARLVAASSAASDASRDAVCAGLQRAKEISTSPYDRAWVLRRAFDIVLATEQGTTLPVDADYPEVARGAWISIKQESGWDACRSGHPVTYPVANPSPTASQQTASPPASPGSPPASGNVISAAAGGRTAGTSFLAATTTLALLYLSLRA